MAGGHDGTGEFQTFRKPLLALLPIGFLLSLRFVDEFLAVRALGIFCLLAAEPQLDAAFLRSDAARLAVTVFAYILVVLGILLGHDAVSVARPDQLELAQSIALARVACHLPDLRRGRARAGPDQIPEFRSTNGAPGMKRILVVRGGAIGDFILTLPALKSLREAHSSAHIEILGYAHIAALAEKRFYADAVRSIEYGALSRFFARGADLPDDLADYFAGFDLIISYLFDPDRIFQTNLERAGAENILIGPAKLIPGSHAATQLARPMIYDLELPISATGAQLFPSNEDRAAAEEFLRDLPRPIIALHPGSGSEKKNWPFPNWRELATRLLGEKAFTGSLLLIFGEADQAQAGALESLGSTRRVRFARSLPLPELAAILGQTVFVGHDSGISHLAAAAGARCLLLFGPTDPAVWAPTNPDVEILRAPGHSLPNIAVDDVEREVRRILSG